MSAGETSWSKTAVVEISWTKTSGSETSKWRNVLGAKRRGPKKSPGAISPGPKCQGLNRLDSKYQGERHSPKCGGGAKRPGPKSQGAKRPGPKYQGAKLPGPKCQGAKRHPGP